MQLDQINRLLGFEYRENILILDGVSSVQLINEFGSPLLVLSTRRLVNNYESIKKAFSKEFSDLSIVYALKANYLPSVCSSLAKKGSGAEVMTGLELFLAERVGFDPARMVFNGPAKTTSELLQATEVGVGLINAESLEEIEELATTQWSNPLNLVGIRISPKMPKEIRRNALVRPESKLGLDIDRAFKSVKKFAITTGFPLGAVSIHVGCRHPPGLEVFENSTKELAAFGRRLEKELGIELEAVDIGGGFPSRYMLEQTGTNIEAFAAIAGEQLAGLRSSPTVVVEPGRYLVGDAMVCLASVVRKKKSGGQNWALLDVGVNILIPLGFAKYDIVPCRPIAPRKERLSIGGPLCQPNDEFVRDLSIDLDKNDRIAILNAGAYTLSMAGRFGYPQPAIVKLETGRVTLIRQRESFKDTLSSLETNSPSSLG